MKSPFSGLPREVAVLVAVAVAVAIGFGIVAPAIPVFAQSFGVGKTAAGAVISAFALMRFVSALAGGRMVDAFGERIILSTGIFIVAGSTGLAGLSQNYTQLLILRGIGGVGSAMFTVSATALLFRVVDNTNRGRATGLFQSGFLIGGLLGPLVGGVLTDYSLRLPFYVYAVSLIAAGSIAAVFLQSAKLRDEVMTTKVSSDGVLIEEPQTTSLSQAWAHPSYRAAVAVNFAIGFVLFGVRMSLVPLFVTEGMGERPVWIGVGFLCSSIAQVGFLVFAGRYVDRAGRKPAMVAGSLITAVSLGMITFSTQLPVFLVSMIAMGAGGAFVGTAPGAVVGDVMQGRGGRVVAVFQMASDLGAITGPLIAGLLADSVTFGTGFGACAIVLLFAAWMSARMPETLIRA